MMSKTPFITVIIVTHNSHAYIGKNISSLNEQTRPPDQIILVDSKSDDVSYLDPFKSKAVCLYSKAEIGFCVGNNRGLERVDPRTDYVLFLNPDAFLDKYFISEALEFMERAENFDCGALSSPLLGYDFKQDAPTGLYDSLGIFFTWYGRPYDRGQGLPVHSFSSMDVEEVPALCGALMFCRKNALDQVLLKNGDLFDRAFYMYKEDIDLSLRLQEKGWKLLLLPHLRAYHGRGWAKNRSAMPRRLRLLSAQNEIRLNIRAKAFFRLPYSFLKWAVVKLLDI